jgi:transcriptional regulator with XRE-family HTH domain
MTTLRIMTSQLDRRRKDLGMTCSTLAKRAGLGLRTVQRVLSDEEGAAHFSTVVRIADALGVTIKFECADLNEVRLRAAERKAEQLVGMVQGTMALEAQGIENETLRQMKARTVRDLLAGSGQKLWDA